VSSEALERAQSLSRTLRDIERGLPTVRLSPTEAGIALALLAEVGRLERERDEARKWANTMEHERDWETQVVHSELLLRADDAEAALAVAREREQRAMKAMVEAAIPLEVLAGQIRTKPYRELTDELQAEIERAVLIIRAALVDENPMKTSGEPAAASDVLGGVESAMAAENARRSAAATLAEPESREAVSLRSQQRLKPAGPPSGSASAAADEPGETP
jgi:hypothetical protein